MWAKICVDNQNVQQKGDKHIIQRTLSEKEKKEEKSGAGEKELKKITSAK